MDIRTILSSWARRFFHPRVAPPHRKRAGNWVRLAVESLEDRTVPSAPTVSGLSPASGSTGGGTLTHVYGTNFTNVAGVAVGNQTASFSVISANQLDVTTPAESAGTVDVRVMNPDGMSPITSADQFTFTAPPPTISFVSPNHGSTTGGNVIQIGGANFADASAVHFGNVSASFSIDNPLVIHATVPAGSPGAVDVTVTSSSGTSATSSGDLYTYQLPPAAVADAYVVTPGQTLNVDAAHGVLANDSDPNGDTLTMAVVSQPQHGSLAPSSNGAFSYTPAMGFTGIDHWIYQASDGSMQSGVTTVTMDVNQVTLTNPGNQANNEGDTIQWSLSATDAAGNPIVYSVDGLPLGLNVAPSAGIIWGTVQNQASIVGTYAVAVTATDSADPNVSATQTFGWTIHPSVTLANPGSAANAVGDTIDLPLTATDSAGNAVVYSATNLPSGLIIDSNTGVISRTVGVWASMTGSYAVTVTATDAADSNAHALQSFTWTISASGSVTVSLSSPGSQTNADGDAVSLALTARDSAANDLYFTATGLPTGLAIDPTSGVISGTLDPRADSSGPYTVTVIASDTVNPTIGARQTFTWTVNYGVGSTLQNPGAQANANSDTIYLPVGLNGFGRPAVTYSAAGLPSGLSIDSATGVISGTLAANADAGSPYTVTATATDANDNTITASKTFTWAVASTGTVTVQWANPGVQSSTEGDSMNLALSATDSASNALRFSASGLPPGLSIDGSTGVISGFIDPAASNFGPYTVTATATDGSNPSIGSKISFQWNVNPSSIVTVTLPPVTDQTDYDGDPVQLDMGAQDSAGDPLTYSFTSLPSGLSGDPNTGLITGTIAASADLQSPYDVGVTATDSVANVSSTKNFQWVVQPPPIVQAPPDFLVTMDNPGNQFSYPGQSISMKFTLRPENPRLVPPNGLILPQYQFEGLPPGLNPGFLNNGILSGTISPQALGTYDVTVTATNILNNTQTSQVAFQWTVAAATIVGPTTVPGNSRYTFTYAAPGRPDPSLGFWVTNPAGANIAAVTNGPATWYPIANGPGVTVYRGVFSFANTDPGVVTVSFSRGGLNFQPYQLLTSVDVTVVKVIVGNATRGANFTTGTPGDGTPNVNRLINGQILADGVASGRVGPNPPALNPAGSRPGLNWNADVTLEGPTIGAVRNAGVNRITVGFIQHSSNQFWRGTYADGTTLHHLFEGYGALLDGPSTFHPWYASTAASGGSADAPPNPPGFLNFTTGGPGNPGISSVTIGSWDTPNIPVPSNSNASRVADEDHALTAIGLLQIFRLDVAAATQDTGAAANQSQWGESGATWTFNGFGTVQFVSANRVRWTAGNNAGVSAPAGWTSVQTLTPEVLTTITASNLLDRFFIFHR